MIKDISKVNGKDVKVLTGNHIGKTVKVVSIDKDPVNNKDRILVEKEGVGGAQVEYNKLVMDEEGIFCCPKCNEKINKIENNKRYYYSEMLEEVE